MAPRTPISRHHEPTTTTTTMQPPSPTSQAFHTPTSIASTSTRTHSRPLRARQLSSPTTHDATLTPPWKKHRPHRRPPSSDWALLWPRPARWTCPPGASRATGFAGCRYVEPPAVFDPEIEGLPDWVDGGDRDRRLWSGVDRVVVLNEEAEGEEEGKKKVVRREVDGVDGDGDVDGDEDVERGEMHGRAVFSLPQPHLPHRHSIERHQQYPTTEAVLDSISTSTSTIPPSTSTPNPTPTSTSTSTPPPHPSPSPQTKPLLRPPPPPPLLPAAAPSPKGQRIGHALSGIALPILVVASFGCIVLLVFWWQVSRRRRRQRERMRLAQGMRSSSSASTSLSTNGDAEEGMEMSTTRRGGEEGSTGTGMGSWRDVPLP